MNRRLPWTAAESLIRLSIQVPQCDFHFLIVVRLYFTCAITPLLSALTSSHFIHLYRESQCCPVPSILEAVPSMVTIFWLLTAELVMPLYSRDSSCCRQLLSRVAYFPWPHWFYPSHSSHADVQISDNHLLGERISKWVCAIDLTREVLQLLTSHIRARCLGWQIL